MFNPFGGNSLTSVENNLQVLCKVSEGLYI
jgi:hypothetical protein